MDVVFENLRLALEEYAREYVEDLKTKMLKKNSKGYNRVASGNMLASLKTRVDQQGQIISVYLKHLHYMKWLEEGTRPHYPPKKPIGDWIREKRIPTHQSKGDGLPTEDQLNFLIRRKIGKYGTEGQPLMKETNLGLEKTYTKKFEKALGEDVNKIYGDLMTDFKGFFDFK